MIFFKENNGIIKGFQYKKKILQKLEKPNKIEFTYFITSRSTYASFKKGKLLFVALQEKESF